MVIIVFLFKNIFGFCHVQFVFHTIQVDIGFSDTSIHQIMVLYIQNRCVTDIPLGFADKVCCMKISRNRIGKYAAEFWTHVGDTFFCGDIFRASITVGWLVVSADACWQLRWSQAFVGGVSLENSHHCLCDGQHKGPKWLRATGCVWIFVCSANICVCV